GAAARVRQPAVRPGARGLLPDGVRQLGCAVGPDERGAPKPLLRPRHAALRRGPSHPAPGGAAGGEPRGRGPARPLGACRAPALSEEEAAMSTSTPSIEIEPPESRWERFVGFFVDNELVVLVGLAILVVAGLAYAPFRWELGPLPRDPVPVDALPDISENQQIVFTEWPGRSPRD